MDPPCKIDTDTLSPRNAETQEQDLDNAILSMDPTRKLVRNGIVCSEKPLLARETAKVQMFSLNSLQMEVSIRT